MTLELSVLLQILICSRISSSFTRPLLLPRNTSTKEWTGVSMHFAVGGEKDTSVPFCKWLMDGTTNGLGSIHSEIHGISIGFHSIIGLFSNLHNREEAVRGQGELEPTGSRLLPLLKEKTYGHWKETIRLWQYLESHVWPLATYSDSVEAIACKCSFVPDPVREEANRHHLILSSNQCY